MFLPRIAHRPVAFTRAANAGEQPPDDHDQPKRDQHAEHADRLKVHTEFHDTVVVEGAGGLLVRLDTDGGTLLDLAVWLVERDVDVEVVVVCAAGLGTLNHTELTVGALQARGVPVRGLVIGSWPDSPGLAETCNREDLPRVTGVPLLGAVPAGAGALGREEFTAAAAAWLPGW